MAAAPRRGPWGAERPALPAFVAHGACERNAFADRVLTEEADSGVIWHGLGLWVQVRQPPGAWMGSGKSVEASDGGRLADGSGERPGPSGRCCGGSPERDGPEQVVGQGEPDQHRPDLGPAPDTNRGQAAVAGQGDDAFGGRGPLAVDRLGRLGRHPGRHAATAGVSR